MPFALQKMGNIWKDLTLNMSTNRNFPSVGQHWPQAAKNMATTWSGSERAAIGAGICKAEVSSAPQSSPRFGYLLRYPTTSAQLQLQSVRIVGTKLWETMITAGEMTRMARTRDGRTTPRLRNAPSRCVTPIMWTPLGQHNCSTPRDAADVTHYACPEN